MLSEILKSDTQLPHQQLEKHLVQKIKAITTVKDYTHILKKFYGFILPLEKDINTYITQEVPDLAVRRKTAALLHDIYFFEDFDPAKTALCPHQHLPVINSAATALGALYVLEGSTLGGEIITGLITKKLGVNADNGFTFFRSYNGQRMAMWLSFKNMLDNYGRHGDIGEVTSSAKQTFTQFYYWLTNHENNQ